MVNYLKTMDTYCGIFQQELLQNTISRDYGFLKVDVVNGKIPQWVYDEVGTKLPKYPRLRLRFTKTEPK